MCDSGAANESYSAMILLSCMTARRYLSISPEAIYGSCPRQNHTRAFRHCPIMTAVP